MYTPYNHSNLELLVYYIILHGFQELTDVDILNESEEGAEELITALAEAEAPSLLLHNLARLDEQVPDERDAVHNTLGAYLFTIFHPGFDDTAHTILFIYEMSNIFFNLSTEPFKILT